MKKILFISFITLQLSFGLFAAENSLRKVDDFRGYTEDFQISIRVVSLKDGKTNEITFFSNGEQSLIRFEAPIKNKGRIILMESAKNLWISIPNRRNIIRISPVQRLLGEVSIGDVASVRFNDYYQIKETSELENDTTRLELEPKSKVAQYSKINLFVESKTYKPLMAEFFAKSGRLLKTGTYDEFRQFKNDYKLSKMTVADAVVKDNRTEIYYLEYREIKLPKDFFRKENLDNVR